MVTLANLEPATTYYYRVAGIGASSVTSRFRTAPADEDSRFSFAVVGDSGDGEGCNWRWPGCWGV